MRHAARCLLVAIAFASRSTIAAADPSGSRDLERTVALMAKISSCSAPSFSPDGKRIAFVSNMNGVPQIWTVSADGGWPELVTALDDAVGGVQWSPDGAWLAFNVAPGGGMNEQVYLVHQDGTGLRRLTDGSKENNRLGPWSYDGRRLALGSNRRRSDAIDAYIYDLGTNQNRLVSENRGTGGFDDLSRDGKWALLDRLVSRGDNNLFVVDVASGKETCITPHTGPGSFYGAFAADGRAVYMASDLDRDRRAFVRLPLDAAGQPGKPEVLAARDDAELQGFALDDAGRTAAITWNVAGRTELAFVDLKSGKSRPGPRLPSEIASWLEFSRDGTKLVMTCGGSARPSDLWVLDIARGTLAQVTHSPHAGVDLDALVRPELVQYKGQDGLPLSGWLYKPRAGSAPYPIVLSFHGGPEGQERPGFSSTYQALLTNGIAVFAPNVRGSSGFGKKFVNLDNGELRFDGIKDIESSIRCVVQSGVADPKRIGIMGGSYGGYMVMAGLTEYPDLFAAGADLYGVVNFETFFAHTEPWMAAISTIEYGDPKTQADLLRRLSPIHKVDRVVAPTIVLHGANDTNVPVVEAEQVVESLKKRNVPVDYVLFPDEGHGWRKTPNRIRSTVAIVQWFDKYLNVADANGTARR